MGCRGRSCVFPTKSLQPTPGAWADAGTGRRDWPRPRLDATEQKRTGEPEADACSQGKRVSLASWNVRFCFPVMRVKET